MTSAKRTVPDLPTMNEADVPGFESTLWVGLFAPAATPRDIVARENAEMNISAPLRNMARAAAG